MKETDSESDWAIPSEGRDVGRLWQVSNPRKPSEAVTRKRIAELIRLRETTAVDQPMTINRGPHAGVRNA